MFQTKRNAMVVCKVATLSKLIAPSLATLSTSSPKEEHELLRTASRFFLEQPVPFRPALDLRTVGNERADEDALPSSAKRMRNASNL